MKLEKLPFKGEFETVNILKELTKASSILAELKGIARTMPNQNILINAIMINEAKSSASIENIVTTHDEIYKAMSGGENASAAAKEVVDYRSAMWKGYSNIKENEVITVNTIKEIQEKVEHNNAGVRSTLGTVLKNSMTGEVVYTPPQSKDEIMDYLENLIEYINTDNEDDIHPLIKMSLIHYQFESIHPFYDGNGRTGRIVNILYLILKKKLDVPILYLSKYIINNKSKYYELFTSTRETHNFEDWIIYFLKGIEETSSYTIEIINKITNAMETTKKELKEKTKIYSKELLETLYYDFYTKTPYIEKALAVSNKTASRYLNTLEEVGILTSEKIGRERIYKNVLLFNIIKETENDR